MKRFTVLIAALVLALSLTACADTGAGLPEGEPSVTANSREGYAASLAMDGDISTGWIGTKKANETVPQTVVIDLGKETEFSVITIDDTFSDGFTNKKPDYVPVSFNPYRSTSSEMPEDGGKSAIVNMWSGEADGRSWSSKEVPTESAPQWFCFNLRAPKDVSKLVFDNEMNSSVPESFAVYYSSVAVEQSDISDKSKYTLLKKVENNEEFICGIELEQSVSVYAMYVEFYSQVKEGEPAPASLDELFFYSPAGADYTEPHQPVRFHLMGSVDGEKYETFAEENGNYNEVWTRTLASPVKYRFIKYLLFEENNNNYPSIGEISFSL